ncbi:hypothetical protein JRQ81_002937 [Phrynocephalus forsythii]|uniref:Centromere protein P n=1 Tax=Phrynocephalus forsythii TaxID=171643 RepID=A0A9Q0XJU9_9SAUR|nr:hypothetical protein JRQ81_002937 [Phrynocephalus forsythii]
MDKNNIQVYRDEIRALEEEIKMLKEEYECSQHSSVDYSDGKIRTARKSSKGSPQEDLELCESFPDLKAQLDLFETDLSFITKLTGICFTYYSRKPVEKSGTKTAHHYRLSGNCQSVPFQVEFQILEDNQSDKSILAIVTDLNIIIESEEHADLSKFVSSLSVIGGIGFWESGLLCNYLSHLVYRHQKITSVFGHSQPLLGGVGLKHHMNFAGISISREICEENTLLVGREWQLAEV